MQTPDQSIPRYPTRTVVTRSGVRVRGFLCCGPYESLLECDALKVLLADPRFETIVPQPFEVNYLDGSKTRRHFPDIAADGPNACVVIEVKSDKKAADPKIRRLEAIMRGIFAEYGRHYFVWPASAIRRQPRLKNVRLLYNYAALEPDPALLLMTSEIVSRIPGISAGELADQLGIRELPLVYSMLGRRLLDFDRHKPLSVQSKLWLPNHALMSVSASPRPLERREQTANDGATVSAETIERWLRLNPSTEAGL